MEKKIIPERLIIEMPEKYKKREHKAVQKKLFSLGFEWFSGEKSFIHNLFPKQYYIYGARGSIFCCRKYCKTCLQVCDDYQYAEKIKNKEFLKTKYEKIQQEVSMETEERRQLEKFKKELISTGFFSQDLWDDLPKLDKYQLKLIQLVFVAGKEFERKKALNEISVLIEEYKTKRRALHDNSNP